MKRLTQTFDGGLAIIGEISGIGPEGSATSSRTDDENPTTVALHQNYPNPFNPATIVLVEAYILITLLHLLTHIRNYMDHL